MHNIEIIGEKNIRIPEGYMKIWDDMNIKEGDKVAMVSITDIQKKEFQLTWIPADASEIGKLKKYAGAIVVRRV